MIDYDNLAANYARHRTLHPDVLRQLIDALPASPARIFEAGCGTGNYIIALQAVSQAQAWGSDPSPAMLEKAQEKNSPVHFSLGRAEALGFPSNSFNLIFSVDVIHHVQDPARYFQEAYRVLSPGGRICTVTDSEWIIRHRQPLSVYFPDTIAPELDRYPPIPALEESLIAAGFVRILETQVEFAYPTTDISMYRDKAFSCLHLIPVKAHRQGLARLEQDLLAGPVQCVSRYCLVWGQKPALA